jgi:metal-responsive CopG/Arc/MetJ family transcriptional regulator
VKRGPGRPRTGERIHIQLPTELLARVNAYAQTRGVTRSEAIRKLLTDQLDAR